MTILAVLVFLHWFRIRKQEILLFRTCEFLNFHVVWLSGFQWPRQGSGTGWNVSHPTSAPSWSATFYRRRFQPQTDHSQDCCLEERLFPCCCCWLAFLMHSVIFHWVADKLHHNLWSNFKAYLPFGSNSLWLISAFEWGSLKALLHRWVDPSVSRLCMVSAKTKPFCKLE